MKKFFKIGGFLIATLLLLTGCPRYDAAIYNSKNNPINSKVSADKVYEAIKIAGNSLGWKISKIKEGKLQGKLALRNHIASVLITYNKDKYDIVYSSSMNLKYNETNKTIHSNYNGWVLRLEKAINIQLSFLNN